MLRLPSTYSLASLSTIYEIHIICIMVCKTTAHPFGWVSNISPIHHRHAIYHHIFHSNPVQPHTDTEIPFFAKELLNKSITEIEFGNKNGFKYQISIYSMLILIHFHHHIDTLRLKRIVWNSMPFQCIQSNYKICSSHIVTNQQTYPSKNKSSIFGKFLSPFTAFTARSVFFFFFFFLSFHTKVFLFAHWPLYSFGYSVIVENYLFFLHIAVSPLDVKPLTTAKNTWQFCWIYCYCSTRRK